MTLRIGDWVARRAIFGGLFLVAVSAAAHAQPDPPEEFTGKLQLDGSSTVFPISQLVAIEFMKAHPNVKVTIGISGTGGGFKRFSRGDTDISDASRPIKAAEVAACEENGVEFIELPVAYDALAIVVNPENDWAREFTIDDLKKTFLAEGAEKWSDLRDGWPDEPIRIYAPGMDSGTYDYLYGDVLNRDQRGAPREKGISFSEDDSVLVEGVARNKYSIGFMGFAFYQANRDKLKAVPLALDDMKKAAPSIMTIEDGAYPLSRPLFIYVNAKSLERPECDAFVEFFLDNGTKLASKVGYIPLNDKVTGRIRKRWEMRHTGTLFLTDQKEPRRDSLMTIYAP